jgi:hypothetical protein
VHVRLERAVHVLALVADVAHQIILCPYVRPPGVPISMRGSTQVAKLGSIRTLQGLALDTMCGQFLCIAHSWFHPSSHTHLGRHGGPILHDGHGDDVLELEVLYGEVDDGGVFLHEKVVFGEALDVEDLRGPRGAVAQPSSAGLKLSKAHGGLQVNSTTQVSY